MELRIVAMPSPDQVYFPGTLAPDYRKDFPQTYIKEFAAQHSIPFLDLLPGLENFARKNKAPLYHRGFGHLTNEGHRAVADLLRDLFEDDPR